MKKPEWPGIATAVGIILIATLIIVGSRDDFHLKDWQTLIAGMLAIVAAAIAYRGATAQVRLSKAAAETETNRRKLALYMKIEFCFRRLKEEAAHLDGKFMFGSAFDTIYSPEDFLLDEPDELAEAWEYLDIFPRTIIAEIRTVRNSLRQLARIHASIEDAFMVAQGADEPYQVSQGRLFVDDIRTACALVAAELEPLIKELAPANGRK